MKSDTELKLCKLDGCQKPAGNSKGMCPGHYQQHRCAIHRQKVADGLIPPVVEPVVINRNQDGYVIVTAPDHPLATSYGRVSEHRRIAYNKYGPGPHPCNWCQVALEWQVIQVDHLDWVRNNNQPNNLVISCRNCNLARKQPTTDVEEVQASKAAGDKLRQLAARLRD